jgi:hypothetical protein
MTIQASASAWADFWNGLGISPDWALGILVGSIMICALLKMM